MSDDTKLLPCPFCGGPAGFEECPQTMSCTWSVGCKNGDEDCIGYQMLAHFNRKSEAAEAWNKRPDADEIERLTAEAKSYRDAIEWMRARDDRNGSLPEAYREKIDEALGGLMP